MTFRLDRPWGRLLTLPLMLAAAPLARADLHDLLHHGPPVACDACAATAPACWQWQLQETEETVYKVEFKEKKRKVAVPRLKVALEKIVEPHCRPINRTVNREFPASYPGCRQVHPPDLVPACGGCGACDACMNPQAQGPITCDVDCPPELAPVVEYNAVTVGLERVEAFYSRECAEEEIVELVPVRVPTTIKVRKWVRVPVSASTTGCADCAGLSAPVRVQPLVSRPPYLPSEQGGMQYLPTEASGFQYLPTETSAQQINLLPTEGN